MPHTVINRQGEKEAWDVNRIRKVVQWATEGLADYIVLEASLNSDLPPVVKAKDIQKMLIETALKLTSWESVNWRYVAGRLKLWDFYKEIERVRGKTYGDFYQDYLVNVLPEKVFNKLKSAYSEEFLKNCDFFIKPEKDKDFDYAGAHLLINRYLLPGELPQEAFLAIALLLCSKENLDPDEKQELVVKVYDALADRKISLATPILANLRTANENLTSCFILSVEDNIKSIFKKIQDVAMISKEGGGVGICLSAVRATGASVMGKPNASNGVIPWMKILNDTAIAVNQGGKRAGAITVALDAWHLDIPEFLEVQEETGDLRRKCFDIFPQVVVTDLFMKRVMSNSHWSLFDPHEVLQVTGISLEKLWGDEFSEFYVLLEGMVGTKLKLTKKIDARALYKKILQVQMETGMPYIAFKDTINKANPNKRSGYIPCVNLCTESFSNVSDSHYHSCNLMSLNLANIDTLEELGMLSRLCIQLLDNTIDVGEAPVIEAKQHNEEYRTLGLGVMGLADWLAKRKIPYDIDALDTIDTVFEYISLNAIKSSIALAKERGTFKAYIHSEWNLGKILGHTDISKISHKFSSEWEQVMKDLAKYGIRNSQLMAIAPNSSSSLIQGCTASILPPFSKLFFDKNGELATPVAPPFVDKYPMVYLENKNINQGVVVDFVSTMQKWIDTGISMELIFNLNMIIGENNKRISPKDIFEVHIKAWEQGCKAIYYIRSIQKDEYGLAYNEENCVGCAN